MPPRIAAIILAAGRSSRMGKINKLTESVRGLPMVSHAVQAALGGGCDPVVAVTGHDASAVAGVLRACPIQVIHAGDHEEGIAASLRQGVAGLPSDIHGALVLLGDMPEVSAAHVIRLKQAFTDGRIVVPVCDGQRGNPVLWPKRLFEDLMALHGDVGGRQILDRHAAEITTVSFDDDPGAARGLRLDLDTPEALADYRAYAKHAQ